MGRFAQVMDMAVAGSGRVLLEGNIHTEGKSGGGRDGYMIDPGFGSLQLQVNNAPFDQCFSDDAGFQICSSGCEHSVHCEVAAMFLFGFSFVPPHIGSELEFCPVQNQHLSSEVQLCEILKHYIWKIKHIWSFVTLNIRLYRTCGERTTYEHRERLLLQYKRDHYWSVQKRNALSVWSQKCFLGWSL